MLDWKSMSFCVSNWKTLIKQDFENTSDKIVSVLFDKVGMLNRSVISTA